MRSPGRWGGGRDDGGEVATADAMALRVTELSSVLKQQRDEIEEQKAILEHNRKMLADHENIIRMQESQLIERDAQLQSQNAEIRALRRQHTMDAEALRAAQQQIQGRIRPSGSMGVPKAIQQQQRGRSQERSGPMSPARQSDAGSTAAVPSPSASPSKDVIAPLRKQLQQAIADKVVLVRALHKLTGEMAEARAEAKKFQAMSERSLSTAWRLGQLGQLGLALLETGDDDEQLDQQAIGYSDGGGSTSRGLSMQVSEPDLDRRWEALLSANEISPPLTERMSALGVM